VRSPRRARWVAIPVAAAAAFALAGCTQEQLQGYLPGSPDITNHTSGIIGLWVTSWIVLLAVGVITWGLIIWAAIAYRRRKGQTGLPPQLRYNMPIEVFYTIVPLILVLGFFAFTVKEQVSIETRDPDPDITIEAYGKQWSWDFNYLNEDRYSTGIQGQPTGEGAGSSIDLDLLPTLYLPVDKTVEIQLKSRDVAHSFWIIEFLYKKDMLPGKTNYMTFTPTEIGEYRGKCAELCGEYHSMMMFNVEVLSQEDYDAKVAALPEGRLGDEYNRNNNLPGTQAPLVEDGESDGE
jgi:cytochrome c oxidase subunit 2